MARHGRLTLGLFNSYDRTRFAEAHRRALARAGAVAAAFDCNLATFGFPFHLMPNANEGRQPADIARAVADSTTIGSGGAYFVSLAEEGRFHTEALPAGGFPPQYGHPVLATSRIEPGQGASAAALAARLRRGQSLLLIVGLGPHGFPRSLERIVDDKWDITGRSLSLETCTALSAAPAILHTHLQLPPPPNKGAHA